MRKFVLGCAAAASVVVASAAWAADAASKWTWKMRRGETEITSNAEFKVEGEKLTGFVTAGPNNQKVEIKEGTFKNNEVAFVVVRMRQDREFKIRYKGKVGGDTIKGTTIVNFNGEDRTREWMATRVKPAQ
jgi:hypothetical protein